MKSGEPETTVQTEILVQGTSAWDGTAYERYPSGQPELSVLRIAIPAHKELPWHTHPMPNATHVISGSITLEHRATGMKRTIRPGDTLIEWMNEEHRGVTGDEPCVVVNFYAGSRGLALSTPAPGEQPEMPDL